MIKKLFILCMALMWTAALMAQNIAVVSPSGSTIMCKTLTQAVDTAAAGSVIYLPGGKFVGNIHINKKLTIIGIGHKSKAESPDGITFIDGMVYFDEGSSGSALMGCNLDDNVYITNPEVNDILIRHNKIHQIFTCGNRTFINQNYINYIYGTYNTSTNFASNTSVTHNVVSVISQVCDGIISNNIICASNQCLTECQRTNITDNIIIGYTYKCNFNYVFRNMMTTDYGERCINIGNVNWSDVFVKYDSGNNYMNSDFHLKGEYKQYEEQVGIYAGTGFSDKQLAPVPYIVSKHVDEQTNAQGMLNIKVRVKAGDSE